MIFTIAIPTYNNENTIHRAIESALNQDYSDDYEVLIVNNASTDKTLDVIKRYQDEKIRIINNLKTVTLFENHNVCFANAKGKYVLFCHSDDELFSNALQILNEQIEKRHYPSKYIVWGHSIFRDFYPSLVNANQHINEVFSGEQALRTFMRGGLTPSGTCYSKDAIEALGGFPHFKYPIAPGDWYLMLFAAFNHFEFEMIDRMIFKREYASTAVRTITQKQWLQNNKEAFEKLFEKLSEQQRCILVPILMRYASVEIFPCYTEQLSYSTKIKYWIKQFIKHPSSIKILFRTIYS